MKKRLYLTGASGMLGEAFLRMAPASWELFSIARTKVSNIVSTDIREKKTLQDQIRRFQPDCIVHAAAITSPEYCENNQKEAYEINVKGTEHLVTIAKEFNIPFVYISSSGVFDGKKDWYKEDDKPKPITFYGKTKYEAEIIVSTYAPHVIIRAGWMVGGGEKKDKKFVGQILLQLVSGKKKLHVVNDKFGTITATEDMVNSIFYLIEKKAHGIYHCAAEEGLSRHEVALIISKLVNFSGDVISVSSDYFSQQFIVKRPRSERLYSQKLRMLGIQSLRSTEKILTDYISLWQ